MTTVAAGASWRTAASVSSAERLSTTTSSSPEPSWRHSAGSVARTADALLYVTMTTDSGPASTRDMGAGMLACGPSEARLDSHVLARGRTHILGGDERNSPRRPTFQASIGYGRLHPILSAPVLERSTCLAVVPAYNEAATVAGVVEALHERTPQLDVVVVNDGSTDATA